MNAHLRAVCLALLAAIVSLAPAQAQTVGVVLVHGKQSTPGPFERMAEGLEQAGYLAERPEMCWSRQRIYDKEYLACLAELDGVVAKLRGRGATDIVIAGQSLGGNGVLGYGARHHELKGVVAFAPAHAPQFLSQQPRIAGSLDKARAMIAKGEGDLKATFNDVNTTRDGPIEYTVEVTPKIYLSFFASDSSAVMPANAAKLTAPLLLISGMQDQSQRGARAIYQAAPANPLNRFVSVEATHTETPAKGREAMMAWLKELTGR